MKTATRLLLSTLLCLLFIGNVIPVFSQYILNGTATRDNCNCYTLTQPQQFQGGSVWNGNKINLNNSFDFSFNVYLGCLDSSGADGIVFILQPISTSLGASGGGMGFLGITPSVGITLDTWMNTEFNDPFYDHISIQANGDITHGNDLAGPVTISPTSNNVEDCQWHILRIQWNATSKRLIASFDGDLRVFANIDLVATIFNNDPEVFWGFAGATGGAVNLQQFCTANNPDFSTGLPGNATCFPNPVTFSDLSVSFAPVQSWYWDLGDGTISTQKNPGIHYYAAPGVYQVKQVITGLDGCISDTLKRNVTIGSKPVADFRIADTCAGQFPLITDLSTNQVGAIDQWTWNLDNNTVYNSQLPVISNLSPGMHSLKLVVRSLYGCYSDTVTRNFQIRPSPVVMMTAPDGCIDAPISFSAIQLDNATLISQWNWDFGNGDLSIQHNPVRTFTTSGWFFVKLYAVATNGCRSALLSDTVHVEELYVYAMDDTVVVPNSTIPLRISYGGNFYGPRSVTWSPTSGLDNPGVPNPKALITDDITYTVLITSNGGCTATDSVTIKSFKGSAVYVPTGFTPNGDGKNDVLRGLYIGIKKVHYFRVYNRWGQIVFSSSSLSSGWDGNVNGNPQPAGVYVWMVKAEDITGKIYGLKGTSVLIR